MDVTIIAVGTELLFGQTVNTNATYLSKNLNLMGFDVMYHHSVGDNPGRLKNLVERSLEDTDMVILTGGLGPTQDDLTKEIVSEVFGAELVFDESVYDELKEYFDERHRHMAENNLKQVYVPEGATIFHNGNGTAPGFAIERNGKYGICLPGPPREMTYMFETHVRGFLEGLTDKKMYYRILRTIGIGESDLETILLPIIDKQVDPTIATYAKEGECSFRIASQRDTIEEAKAAVDAMISDVDKIAGKYIYSYDDEELKAVVVRKLKERNLTIASAESCTGGMFASNITDVPGASGVFGYGFVTYSEAAKASELDVSEDILSNYSAVSPETAVAMAEGVKRVSGADIGISVTGFAGPDADPGRNAGEAYVGYAYGDKKEAVKFETRRADRSWNRNFFMLMMLMIVNEILDGKR
jgi:nicotinamide-nucleotide amidase